MSNVYLAEIVNLHEPSTSDGYPFLWNGDALEVLEPLWLRKEMAGKAKRMWNNYKK